MPTIYEYEKAYTIEQLQKEYARKRRVFNKRIARIAEVDSSSRIAAYQRGGYKEQRTVTQIEQLRGRSKWDKKTQIKDWAKRLAELDNLLAARSLSLGGRAAIRRETIRTLQERGYSITAKNYDNFVKLMNYLKEAGILEQYSSEYVREQYEIYMSGGEVEDSTLQALLDAFIGGETNAVDLFD